MRSRYKIRQNDGLHFVTSTTREWIPIFTSDIHFRIFIDSLIFCQKNRDLKIYAYVILENHFHMIVAGNNLSSTLQSLKRFTAQKIINLAEKQGKVWLLNQFSFYKKRYKTQSKYQMWQEGFHPEMIINDKMLIQKIDYIHYNPVKRGYVDKPEFWKYSSARNYIFNDHSLIKLEKLPMLII